MTTVCERTAAVILPHYEDVTRLTRCLAALQPQVTAEVEVVVVDNGSTTSLTPAREIWPRLRIVREARKGAAHARNRGVTETTAERLFFLDADCVPAPDWLATAQTAVERAEVVGGRIDVFDETGGSRSGAEAFEAVFAFDNRGYVERKGFSVTANLLTTRAVFEAVGGFRPGLSEDLDWCHRARATGFHLVYADDLRVAHPTRANWPALEQKWRRLTNEAWGLEDRSARARVAWGVRALAMLPSIAVHAPTVLRHTALRSGAERRAALATLARLRVRRCGWMLSQAMRGS